MPKQKMLARLITFEPETYEKLREEAMRHGLPVTAIVRLVLSEHVARGGYRRLGERR